MELIKRLNNEYVPTTILPLTAEGRRNMPCHPVSEMDIDEIEKIILSTGKGFIETQSEDEVCDLMAYMEKHTLAKDFNFDIEFPAMLGESFDDGSGPYKFAYEKKSLAPKEE
jgi:hypothetical protein